MSRVNLLPPAARRAHAARARRRGWLRAVRAEAVICAGALALAQLPGVAGADLRDAHTDRLHRKLELVRQSCDELRAKLAETTAHLDATRAVGDHPDWATLLRAMADAGQGEVVIESVTITPKADEDKGKGDAKSKAPRRRVYVLNVAGVARTASEGFAFAKRMQALGVFDGVTPGPSRADTLDKAPVVRFTVEATLSDAPAGAAPGGKP